MYVSGLCKYHTAEEREDHKQIFHCCRLHYFMNTLWPMYIKGIGHRVE